MDIGALFMFVRVLFVVGYNGACMIFLCTPKKRKNANHFPSLTTFSINRKGIGFSGRFVKNLYYKMFSL